VQLTGTGKSIHDMATNGVGKFGAVLPNGEVREAFAELTGINVARGLGLILAKDQKRIGIRCGVATMQVGGGKAEVERLVVDTDTVRIEGDGHIDLAEEAFDLEIDGEPKKVRLLRLRAPVTLEGSIRKPQLGVDKGETAKQAGIAGALGALIAPLTAAFAFIDPGLAKDANCAALLAEAEQAKDAPPNQLAARPAPPAPRSQ